MYWKDCFGLVVKSRSERVVNYIYYLVNKGGYKHKDFEKYFNVWVGNYGIMFFPKRHYFLSWRGIKDYDEALKRYSR